MILLVGVLLFLVGTFFYFFFLKGNNKEEIVEHHEPISKMKLADVNRLKSLPIQQVKTLTLSKECSVRVFFSMPIFNEDSFFQGHHYQLYHLEDLLAWLKLSEDEIRDLFILSLENEIRVLSWCEVRKLIFKLPNPAHYFILLAKAEMQGYTDIRNFYVFCLPNTGEELKLLENGSFSTDYAEIHPYLLRLEQIRIEYWRELNTIGST